MGRLKDVWVGLPGDSEYPRKADAFSWRVVWRSATDFEGTVLTNSLFHLLENSSLKCCCHLLTDLCPCFWGFWVHLCTAELHCILVKVTACWSLSLSTRILQWCVCVSGWWCLCLSHLLVLFECVGSRWIHRILLHSFQALLLIQNNFYNNSENVNCNSVCLTFALPPSFTWFLLLCPNFPLISSYPICYGVQDCYKF